MAKLIVPTFKYLTQDLDGIVKFHAAHPTPVDGCYVSKHEVCVAAQGERNENWESVLIDLDKVNRGYYDHDFTDGILTRTES